MGTLQQQLDALQPYIIGIRYVNGLPLVDVVFKEGWTLPTSETITRTKGDDAMNYYMIYSDKDGIGLDELLLYVQTTIQLNLEKELKLELLKDKVNELKEIFKKVPLNKLKKLKFVLDEITPEIDELNIELDEQLQDTPIEQSVQPVQEIVQENMTEEDMEMVEEEQRAQNYKHYQEQNKKSTIKQSIASKVELPPKNTSNGSCNCGPEEACDKCIDTK